MDSSATNQKISWFRKEHSAGNLNLAPQFQRRQIWSNEQAAYLIDTILSDLPIPEIYVRSKSSPKGDTKYEVVDGQQRITAILKFAADDLVLEGDEISHKWLGMSFGDLSNTQKTNFWDYKIVVRDVTGATDIEIRDLFRRLNINSVVLNDQELRHARYNGKFIKCMESLADDPWWLDSGIVTVRQIRRMEDVEFISELFVGMVAGPQDKKKSLDDYYENFDGAMPDEKEWTENFCTTREFIKGLLSASDLKRWSGKSDFYSLFLAINSLIEKHPKLTALQKKGVVSELKKFRDDVDQAKRKDNSERFSKDIHDYADAVTRAATDQGRRAARLTILEKRIRKSLQK